MDLEIKGKSALVTGAGRGLGRSIALHLAREGVRVAIASRTEEDLRRLVAAMGGEEEGHLAVALDLAAEGGPEALLQALRPRFGDPDIVVHNVGGSLGISDPFCPVEDWRRVWRLNLEIAVELNRKLVPAMQRQRWGRVVHVSSISALENQGAVPYCSVKAALTSYSRALGRVVAADGVVVTAVLPGAVFTEKGYWDTVQRERPEHYEAFLRDRMAIRRFGRPEEIGSVVAFLCSRHASFMVGSSVPVDGGQGRVFFG